MQTEEFKQRQSEIMKEKQAVIKANNISEKKTREENIANLTPEEKAIYQRVASEDRSWETIVEGEVNDYSLSADPFELPEPAKKLRDSHEFAFRWITRSAARLDEIRNKPEIFRWWPVNRTSPRSGLFDPFIDPNNGCVSREDQMLVFKPYWLFEKELNFKRGVADRMHNSTSIDNKAEEKGGAELVGSKSVSKSRLSVNSGDIAYAGEAEADAGMSVTE
jgi:hypothetical protein